MIGFPFLALGQDISVYHQIEGNELRLRWLPNDIDLHQRGIQNGYAIKVYNDGNQAILDTVVTNNLEEQQDASEELSSLYAIGFNDKLIEDFLRERPDTTIESEFNDTILYESYHLLASRNHDLLTAAGLKLETNIKLENPNFRVEITANDPDYLGNPYEFNLSTLQRTPDLPVLSGKWKNKKVELTWNTKGSKEDFIFYNLYFSDDGLQWSKIDSLYANFYTEEDPEALLSINPIKPLPDNDQIYWFAIRGVDYLGYESEAMSMTKGSGSLGIQVSPYFIKVDQLRTNEAHLQWNIPEEYKSEVEEYRVYVAEQYDGPYLPDTFGISPTTFELTREIPFPSTYFRVAAVDQNDQEYSTFPQLIVGVDTLAPAIPTDLNYTLDTNGVLNISWSSNDEDDFLGYKLFYCFDTTVDMTLAHNSYLYSPDFRDTLELKTTNRKVYYKAISVDKRNNRSAFSELLIVEKPDILAPVEPVFISADPGPGTAELKWFASISDDVKEQRLFRRKLGGDENWELLEFWDIAMDTTYEDKQIKGFEKYAYTLVVIDSSGNESDPSIPVVIMPLPDYRQFDISAWDVIMENEEIRILQDLENKAIQKIFIYRKVDDGKLYSIAELDPGTRVFIDENIRNGSTFSYAIKVMFEEGIETRLSEFKTIRK